MSDDAMPTRLQRFLAPRHAAHNCDIIQWQKEGEADTPGADAHCRLYLSCRGECIETAAFAVFGPPVVVACADWVCEWLCRRTIDGARGLSVNDFEKALALAPNERYAALLMIDALARAVENV